MAGIGFASEAELLRIQVDELERSLWHLEKSNQELMEADPHDPVYRQAIIENEDVIHRKRAKVADLKAQLESISSHAAYYPPAPARPAQQARRAGGPDLGVFL
ncbi:Enkurin domain-containing protein [Plasmodiophora brassicae]